MATPESERAGFASPFEVPIPDDCRGWEEMYAYHAVFSEDRRSFDEGRFWFQNSLHTPEPLHPFDCVWLDFALPALSQANTRLFVNPPSLGAEYRILNGYLYLSLNAVTDEETLARRAELFAIRGGHYYRHWTEVYERWVAKVEETIRDLETLVVPELPELEHEAVVTEARGLGSSYHLLCAYDRLLDGLDRMMQYHFELNALGYGAYFEFYERCRQVFPDIPSQTVAKMVSGIDLLVLRPDEELKRLARLALELGVGKTVEGAPDEENLRAALVGSANGVEWLADFEATKNPWFCFSNGNGLYHHHRSWIDDTRLPISAIAAYVRRLDAGEDIARPFGAVLAERERIAAEHRALVPAEMRPLFDESLALARTVYPFIEDHNFYVEHRYFTLFWNKVRLFGSMLVQPGFLAEQEDVFYLRHGEVREALEELRTHWSSGGAGAARGPSYWPSIVERRKSIYEAMREWAPPPALGRAPETVTDPVTVMLYGVTRERVQEWLSSLKGVDNRRLTGFPGSPGVSEGVARVVLHPEQLVELQQGEILVAPSTSPSWTPVFGRIAAAVLDSGGIMCHAAIVAREYGLPAVIGTGSATKRIRTGDRLRVDADAGVVEILA
jgi:pyruvate,water dikinase